MRRNKDGLIEGKESRGFVCHVCDKAIEPGKETVAYFEAVSGDVTLCPDHPDVRDHTCIGMSTPSG